VRPRVPADVDTPEARHRDGLRPDGYLHANVPREVGPERPKHLARDEGLRGRLAALARLVPRRAPAVERERHPVERLAFEPHLTRRHLQPYPLPRGRQRPHVAAAARPVRSPRELVRAPVGAVVPALLVAVPLKHHLRRRIRRVEVDVGHQTLAGPDVQLGGCAREVVLMRAGHNIRLMRRGA
jgi:hypothetical protein